MLLFNASKTVTCVSPPSTQYSYSYAIRNCILFIWVSNARRMHLFLRNVFCISWCCLCVMENRVSANAFERKIIGMNVIIKWQKSHMMFVLSNFFLLNEFMCIQCYLPLLQLAYHACVYACIFMNVYDKSNDNFNIIFHILISYLLYILRAFAWFVDIFSSSLCFDAFCVL